MARCPVVAEGDLDQREVAPATFTELETCLNFQPPVAGFLLFCPMGPQNSGWAKARGSSGEDVSTATVDSVFKGRAWLSQSLHPFSMGSPTVSPRNSEKQTWEADSLEATIEMFPLEPFSISHNLA